MKFWFRPFFAAILLAGFWIFMLASVSRKSVTTDEIVHVTAGYTYWTFGDYRLNPENGNLPQRLMALPLLGSRFPFPARTSPAWVGSDEWEVGDQWFHQMGNDVTAMLIRGRAASALLAVALAALVWFYSRRWFGEAGALVSLLACILNPTILANGPLMTSDIACGFFFLAATMTGWDLLQRFSPLRFGLAGLALSGLFLSKMSAALIVPIGLVLATVRLAEGQPLPVSWGQGSRAVTGRLRLAGVFAAGALALALLVYGAIWGAFGFRYSAFADASPANHFNDTWQHLTDLPTPGAAPVGLVHRGLHWMRRTHILPQAYVFGQAFSLKFAQKRGAFLNGHYALYGWRSFFPYTVLVKTPLPYFVLWGLAGFALRRHWRRYWPLWALIAVYGGALIFSKINIGHRHFLAVYPPLFILAGAAATLAGAARRAAAACLVFIAVEVGCHFPNYLAYFNVVAGGTAHAYRHLVDSSLDWGQDLPAINPYLTAHHLAGPVYLSYFGTGSPAAYGVRAQVMYSLEKPMKYFTFPDAEARDAIGRLLREQPAFDSVASGSQGGMTGVMLLEKPAAFRLQPGTYLISATMLPSLEQNATGPWGPWNDRYEREYQNLKLVAAVFLRDDLPARLAALKEGSVYEWMKILNDYDAYRFARLCAFLRQREADDTINGSILVYHLTGPDLAAALDGPMPEHGPDVLKELERRYRRS
jgi:hypothetical protein